MKNNKKTRNLSEIKKIIIRILKKYGVKKAGIFGSYVRSEQKKRSDIDILIQPPEGMSLFDFSGLKIELEEELDMKVDLVSYRAIHPLLKKQILYEEVKII